MEFYDAEIPMMFYWMRTKGERFRCSKSLGVNKDFVTQRATDNSFYWLTTDDIQQRYLNSDTTWRNSVPLATLRAKIRLDIGVISVGTVGLKNFTVWLAKMAPAKA